MNKSYLIQGFKESRKTLIKKPSNIFAYVFFTIASFLGKLLFIPIPFFKMFDMNIARNAALHNEVNLVESVKDCDDINANKILYILGFLKVVFSISLLIVVSIVLAIIFLLALGLNDYTNLETIPFLAVIPILVIGLLLLIVIVTLFIPTTYVVLHLKEKTIYNVLYCCKNSLSAGLVIRVLLYNLLYLIGVLLVPAIVVVAMIVFELNVLGVVLIALALFAFVYLFGFFKLSRDTAIFLLLKDKVKLDTKYVFNTEVKELTEEEKLTEIFTK